MSDTKTKDRPQDAADLKRRLEQRGPPIVKPNTSAPVTK